MTPALRDRPLFECDDCELHSEVEGTRFKENITYLIDDHGIEGTE